MLIDPAACDRRASCRHNSCSLLCDWHSHSGALSEVTDTQKHITRSSETVGMVCVCMYINIAMSSRKLIW